MDSINSSLGFVGTIKFSTDRTCFLTVHKEWLKNIHSELPVFKVIYGKHERKTAYVSCSRELSRWAVLDTKVFINEKFAKHLSLMEGDPVELQALSISIPMALIVEIEPLSFDDWEILELNSDYVTDKLINQIRVVWIDLIFPVWVENNCIYFKVVACEPNYQPVMLQERTEVRVSPKDRNSSPSHLNGNLQKEKISNYLQFQRLRKYSKSEHPETDDSDESFGNMLESDVSMPSLAAYAPQFLTWLLSPKEEKTSLEEPEYFSEIYDHNFDCVLRVIPFTNPEMTMPHVIQSTTVFINAGTYLKCCGGSEIPPCFVGVIEKYLPPDKRPKKNVSEPIKNNVSDNNNSLTKNGNKSKLEVDDGQKPFDSICVTVMVVKSAEEDEFHLPTKLFTYENAIIVPQELKKALSVEVASQVHLKNVITKPLLAYKIIFHPVTLLNLEITEKVIHEQFRLWAFMNNRKYHTFVISNGTFVKLKIHGKKYQFFIRLEEREVSKNGDSPVNSLDTGKNASLENDNEVYGLLTQKILKRTPIKIGSTMCSTIYDDRIFLIRESAMYCDVKAAKLKELGGIKKLETKAVEGIEFWLKLRPLSYISSHSSTYSGCILICGPKGVGKSAFATALCKKFANHPYHVLVRIVQCLALKGKRVDTIAKKWNELVSEAIHGQPSIILFEDLDYIAGAPLSYEQENGPDGVYYSSISQAFIRMMNRVVSSQSKIVVLTTSNSRHSLHPSLVNTKGRHIFQSILEVNPPNVQQRAEILVALMIKRSHISCKSIPEADILDIARKTEGYVAQDLNTLVDRATHAAWMRLASCQEGDTIALINKDFEIALKGLVPSSLRGVSLQMQDQRTWKDVGGLTKVKKVIQQIIMWPTKYKEIYKNYSLKPQTNILLYGAPGTGKTLLAGVVANECGLNFISIKGPELLSKYIGASEQAVRDLFQRATAAKPCILFFDEFDSIAPRRGHDSTGVTDRVVNQLLTQLDGVESLEGVHVLAATSRPELIDPALLRPGRLDKCLLCPLPDQDERVEILHCLSVKLPLSEDVNFEDIASMTDNFSGADLQALLYTAHIEALNEIQHSSTTCYGGSSEDQDYKRASARLLYIPNLKEGLKNPSEEDGKKIVQEAAVIQGNFFGVRGKESKRHSTLVVSVNQRHLFKVANEMKPSVSFEERIRYQTVFKNFQNVLSGESAALPRYDKKVTLA